MNKIIVSMALTLVMSPLSTQMKLFKITKEPYTPYTIRHCLMSNLHILFLLAFIEMVKFLKDKSLRWGAICGHTKFQLHSVVLMFN